jgi:hypothetical protein
MVASAAISCADLVTGSYSSHVDQQRCDNVIRAVQQQCSNSVNAKHSNHRVLTYTHTDSRRGANACALIPRALINLQLCLLYWYEHWIPIYTQRQLVII